jgi:hypothetical protein
MRSFFQRLTRTARTGRFAGVEVAGRVIEAQAFGRVLFDQHKPAFMLNHCRDSDAGFPSSIHG